jgi:hypothetical protein
MLYGLRMTRRRRREEALELAQRYRDLPHPEKMRPLGRVMFGHALVSGAVQLVLLRLYVQVVRRLWVNRRHGVRATAAAVDYRLLALSTCLYWCYSALAKVLLLRWGRRAVEQAEHDTRATQEKP